MDVGFGVSQSPPLTGIYSTNLFLKNQNDSFRWNIGPETIALHCTVGESLTVAWTEPFVQIYTNIFKILENIWSDFKNICSKLTRPELGKGVKVPSKVKDKQLLEVMKQYCKKVTTETTGKNSTKSRPGQASRRSSRSVEWWSNGFEIVIFYRVLWWEVIKQQGEFILVFIRMKFARLKKKHFFYLL